MVGLVRDGVDPESYSSEISQRVSARPSSKDKSGGMVGHCEEKKNGVKNSGLCFRSHRGKTSTIWAVIPCFESATLF